MYQWSAAAATARAESPGFFQSVWAGRNPFRAIAFPFLGCLTALSTSC